MFSIRSTRQVADVKEHRLSRAEKSYKQAGLLALKNDTCDHEYPLPEIGRAADKQASTSDVERQGGVSKGRRKLIIVYN
jgi:hypothetical protein